MAKMHPTFPTFAFEQWLASIFISLLLLGATTAEAKEKTRYASGHKSVCIAYDDIAWDPKEGIALQLLVDIGFFPPGVDIVVSELAYSLRTPRSHDPMKGSSRLLLNQVWYPVKRRDAKRSERTTHTDFFTNDLSGVPLATSLSTILNLGGLLFLGDGNYPNEPAGYGWILAADPDVVDFVVNGEAGSVEGAPISKKGGPFPVVILDSPAVHQHFGLAEYLAERGYIVVAPTHPNDQLYDGLVDIGDPNLDGLPIGGIPYGLNCSDAEIEAAKPVNGVLDFNADIDDIWLSEEGIYLGNLSLLSSVEDTLFYRAVDIGVLVERAHELFSEPGVVDNDRVGLIGYSLGGNATQTAVSDDASLFPLAARAGLDRVDATVSLAGNNRFASASSRSTMILKPTLALQGRQDLVVNQNSSTYGFASLEEPNPVLLDNYVNRYAPDTPAMRVLIDRFNHSDFRASEPLVACLEHGGSALAVPAGCIDARPVDERVGIVADPAGGIMPGSSYEGRSLEERLAITTYFTGAWLDLYVKGERCSKNARVKIDGKKIPRRLDNVGRLTTDLFDPGSITTEYRDLGEFKACGDDDEDDDRDKGDED